MTPETAAMRPARNGPRLRQARPARGTGAGGRGDGGGTMNVARATSSSERPGSRSEHDIGANMDDSRVGGVAARKNTGEPVVSLAAAWFTPGWRPGFVRPSPPRGVEFFRHPL